MSFSLLTLILSMGRAETIILSALLTLLVFLVAFVMYFFRDAEDSRVKQPVIGKQENTFPWGLVVSLGIIAVIAYGGYAFSKKQQYLTAKYTGKEYMPKRSGNYVFGIDVSHYQSLIRWDKVKQSEHKVKFAFIRATMGHNGTDYYFKRNWKESQKHGFLRGAYHYYRPNENSTKQFNNFKRLVKLKKGDFPPVLDVEEMSRNGVANLRAGVKNWLKLAEAHYGVKPILYTGRTFYTHHLKGHVNGYPLWIASYSSKHSVRKIDWDFHQFSDRVRITGIPVHVDGNDFSGSMAELNTLTIN